jgi:hypothetical protein
VLTSCNAFKRVDELKKTGDRHTFAEQLDANVTRASQIAERRTQKFREPAWSLELAQACKKVSILAKALTMKKTGIEHTDILQAKIHGLSQEQLAIPASMENCSNALKRAKRRVTEIINTSYATRESERDDQIAKLETELAAPRHGTLTKEIKKKLTIFRNLKKAEAIKKLFRKLLILRQTRQHGGITRLEVPSNPNDNPKTCTHLKVINVPTEILQHLQVRNQKHFGQAQGTPFTFPPLSNDLGFTSITEKGTMILNGQYDTDHLDAAVQLLIHHLQANASADIMPLKPSISYDAFTNKLRTWRESTSTSPSGLHLGHYKALLARHKISDLPDRDPCCAELDQKREDILSVHLKLINYALERGYSYRRWQQVANAMLFKEPGNIKIVHRTRVIHLYKADYNLAMGLKWKAAMEQAQSNQVLNTGQYGSQP